MIYFDLKTKSFSEISNDNTYPIESQDDIIQYPQASLVAARYGLKMVK